MALRLSFALFQYRASHARNSLQPSVYCRTPSEVMRKFYILKRLARQNGTLRRTFQLQRREKPCDRRKWNIMDRAYFQKWHHLKYCTQVIKYSIDNGLSFINSVEKDSFRPVANENFGSGRLLRHHLHEVRIDPKDGQRLEFEAMKAKWQKKNDGELSTFYWDEVMQEVREYVGKDGKKTGKLITASDLEREFFFTVDATLAFLSKWESLKAKDGKITKIVPTDRDRHPYVIEERRLVGDGRVKTKAEFLSNASSEDEKKEAERKWETAPKAKLQLTEPLKVLLEDKDTLLRNIFKIGMELVGSRDPSYLDRTSESEKKNSGSSRRSKDRAFSLEELRELAHTKSVGARPDSINTV